MKDMMLLIVIADAHISTECNFPIISFHKIVNYFEDGCLSGSVIAYNSNMFSAFDIHTDI